MASNFRVSSPYILAKLPAPLAKEDGELGFSVGEVLGLNGSKKRKRAELSVGIDRDAVNLYDVSSARIITSYPIPPQSTLTCSPCSLRWKSPTAKEAIRYTYVATQTSRFSKRSITLFKDVLSLTGSSTTTTVSHSYDHSHPIVHLSAATSSQRNSALQNEERSPPVNYLVAVARDGTVLGFDPETLEESWRSAPSVILQEIPAASQRQCQVEMVQPTTAADVLDGIFQGKQEVFRAFSPEIDRERFNPDVILVITAVSHPSVNSRQRNLHAVTLSRSGGPQDPVAGLIQLFSAPIVGSLSMQETTPEYQLDARSGSLLALSNGILNTFSLRESLPRLESSLEIPHIASFLRLSKTSVLASCGGFLEVYNPSFRSLQNRTSLKVREDAQGNPTEDGDLDGAPCKLVSYFGSLNLAVGLQGTSLLAIQVEPPHARSTKRRADGLLIDSIGRGLSQEFGIQQGSLAVQASKVLADYLPGSLHGNYVNQWQKEVAKAEEHFGLGEFSAFEAILVSKFQADTREGKPLPNGTANQDEGRTNRKEDGVDELADGEEFLEYPQVDRRWVLYAINRVFSWVSATSGPDAMHLSCPLSHSKVLGLLVGAGHLSTSNFRSAFKEETLEMEDVEAILNEEVPRLLVQIDPTMELLVHYLAATSIGAVELLTSIRLVMGSLGMVHDPTKLSRRLLTTGEAETSDPEQVAISLELARAEEELQVAEYYYLGDQSSTRAQALSTAFTKLEGCPAVATVQGIRRLYRPEETLSLINILRTELIRDGWTERYLDKSLDDDDTGEEPFNGSIRMIADLLCRCIDSIGPSGWLANEGLFANFGGQHETAEFFQQLQMEVSAALEGIEEVVRLRPILAQAVKYGTKVQEDLSGQSGHVFAKTRGVMTIPVATDVKMLPLGLKGREKISNEKINTTGGEIRRRTKREKGLLISQKVGPYSLERIVI